MRIIIIGCGLILPVLLFLFKYVLPARFEAVLSNKKKEQKGIIKELIHYPNDLLMIAIGYTVPKTFEYLILISSYPAQAQSHVFGLLWNILFTIIVLVCIPFMVSHTKGIEKSYWAGDKKRVKKHSIFLYVLSSVAIIISLILGV